MASERYSSGWATGRTLPERRAARALSAVLVAAIGWGLAVGLSVGVTRRAQEAAASFDVAPTPPPPPRRTVPPPLRSARPEGRAAPPTIRSQATQLVAPASVMPEVVPPLLTVAPVAHRGDEATSGASDRVGPGQGAGGEGSGSGGRGDGNGEGGGRARTAGR